MTRVDRIKEAFALRETRTITQTRFRPRDFTKGSRRRPTRPKPNQCEVCGATPADVHGKDQLRYDHNHATGLFRGWICNGCNSALGHAGENPLVLEALAAYLRREGGSVTRELTPFRPLSCRPLSTVHDRGGVRQA